MNNKVNNGNFFKMATILSMIFFSLTVMNCKKSSKESAAKDSQVRITFIKGSVMVNDKEAKLGEALDDFAIVSTGENSICEISFSERNVIQLQAQSFMKLDFSKLIKEVELKKGSVASILKNLKQEPGEDSFRVRTGTTVAGVRGTTFFVHTDGKKTYVCDCNGSVNVSDIRRTHSELLKNIHHAARVFSMVDGKLKVEEGTLQYHDDKMMEELAAKIDYKVDWNKQD